MASNPCAGGWGRAKRCARAVAAANGDLLDTCTRLTMSMGYNIVASNILTCRVFSATLATSGVLGIPSGTHGGVASIIHEIAKEVHVMRVTKQRGPLICSALVILILGLVSWGGPTAALAAKKEVVFWNTLTQKP
jgi:hypothetical protein